MHVQFMQPQLPLPRDLFLMNGSSPPLEAYSNYKRQVAQLYGADHNSTTHFISTTLAFETQLAQVRGVIESLSRSPQKYTRVCTRHSLVLKMTQSAGRIVNNGVAYPYCLASYS